ncbi:MAG: dTMP kinase [Planctomycetota bacterium]|nr:dTMP kinase [Planctomycetota bacterium]
MTTDHAWIHALRGRFVAFEGADGSGKSTQLRRFIDLARTAGVGLCEVREPGGTHVGERIRAILLDKASDGITLRCEMLLYMASRAQLVETRIRPAIARGELVIADRFVTSTYAYQGSAGGLPEPEIDAVARVACDRTLPDLIIIFDVDEKTAARRTGVEPGGRQHPHAGPSLFADRMEDRDASFRTAVRAGYLAQAARDPARHAVLDASGTPDEVWARLLDALRAFAARPA